MLKAEGTGDKAVVLGFDLNDAPASQVVYTDRSLEIFPIAKEGA